MTYSTNILTENFNPGSWPVSKPRGIRGRQQWKMKKPETATIPTMIWRPSGNLNDVLPEMVAGLPDTIKEIPEIQLTRETSSLSARFCR